MLAALAASGQTPSAFARAKGFPPYRVSYWRAKLAAPERQEPQVPCWLPMSSGGIMIHHAALR